MSGLNDVNPQIEGGSDGTIIGNVGDRLKVTADNSVSNIAFSKKLRVIVLTSTVSITNTVTYTTIYSYTGSGLLIGFNLEFNSVSVVPKLTVDGDVIFSDTDISTYNSLTATASSIDRRQAGHGIVSASATFDWSFKQPIAYSSSITIAARKVSGADKNFNLGIVYLTKET